MGSLTVSPQVMWDRRIVIEEVSQIMTVVPESFVEFRGVVK